MKERTAVWVIKSDIVKLEEIARSARLGFTSPSKTVKYLIAQGNILSEIRHIIEDHDIETDDALQRIVDLVK